MGTVANLVATVGIAGSITIGALSSWNGGAELTAAKNLILKQADSLGIYHTNEGKLLNEISFLNNKISSLNSGTTADQQQIADLQTKLNADEAKLATAQTNGNNLAAAVDTQNGQIDQANADAAALDTTTQANSNVSQSDQTAVNNATPDATDTGTTTSSSGSGTTTPPPTTTPTSSTPTMPAGDTEVDYASVTQPHVLIYNGSSKEVQMNVVSGQVQLMSSSATDVYSYSMDGGQTWTTMPTSFTNIGSTDQINNVEIQVKTGTTVTKFWFVNK